MCDDVSPCDLNAIPRPQKSDDFDRWSIEQAELQNPHFRYQIVCSKWGFLRVLGKGYRYGEARALARILMDACAAARPREDTWTRPIFLLERMYPLIRERCEVGDLAFVPHEANHRYSADGICTYTARQLLVTIESVAESGRVLRASSLSGLVFENPVITKSFAHVDIDIAGFGAHIRNEMAGRSAREVYDYLTSRTRLIETLYRFAMNEVKRTPINCELAVACMRSIGLPEGHQQPTIPEARIKQQVAAVLSSAEIQTLAA